MIRREVTDPHGKWLGLGFFVVGVFLLVFVFYRGFVELVQAGLLHQTLAQAQSPARLDAVVVFSVLARWLFLFLLAYIATAVAGRGIFLYQVARGGGGEET